MALTYKCNTCGKEFPAEISVGRDIYMDGNRRLDLKNENQDCDICEKEVAEEATTITEEARARVRAKKQNGNN